MKIRGRLTYSNVTATLALVAALGTGGAYAQSRIGTSEIQNRAVTGVKVQRNAIRGAGHVLNRTIPGRKLREETIDSRRFAVVGGDDGELSCDPDGENFIDCATVTLNLPRRGRALVIATGGAYSPDEPASGSCDIRIDGGVPPTAAFPGVLADGSSSATNGFTRTLVTPNLDPGSTELSLACSEAVGDFHVGTPTIAAIALTNGHRR